MTVTTLEITPSDRRLFYPVVWRGAFAVFALITIGGGPGPHRIIGALIMAVWALQAGARFVDARRRRRRPLLIIDADGINGPDGDQLRTWADVVAVWVIRPRFLAALMPVRLELYTRAGVNFARRAQSAVRPSGSYFLPTDLAPESICAAITQLTGIRAENDDRRGRVRFRERLAA